MPKFWVCQSCGSNEMTHSVNLLPMLSETVSKNSGVASAFAARVRLDICRP